MAQANGIPSTTDIAYAPRPVRPWQQQFRALVMRVYGATCCVSGCKVTQVLEGAHITPFAEDPKHANHVRNGLLLRSDLHVLFDSDLLAIDPATRVVHFTAAATLWPQYAALSGTATLAKPTPGFEWATPEENRLKARWKQFVATGVAL